MISLYQTKTTNSGDTMYCRSLTIILGAIFYGFIGINAKPDISELEAKLIEALDLANCAGMSVAIVGPEGFSYTKGFGYENIDKGSLVDEHTMFQIGSCTKAFTSYLIGLLVEEGRLKLDESPQRYLDNLEFYNDEMNNKITIRDMLRHTTGLPRHDYSWYLFRTDSRDSLIERIRYLEPIADVGREYRYNNFMYLALGKIIEEVTGKSWEQNLQEYIFQPLGMNASATSIKEIKEGQNLAKGYNTLKDSNEVLPYYKLTVMGPAGSIISCSVDMVKWLSVLANGGRFNGKQLLPSEYFREAMSQQIVVGTGLPASHKDIHFSSYGLGWMLTSYKGRYMVGHGGNIDGFSSSISYFPTDSIAISVFVNQNNSVLPSLCTKIISDIMLDVNEEDWLELLRNESTETEENNIERVSSRIEGTVQSHKLTDYTGNFSQAGYGSFEVDINNECLVAKFPQDSFLLTHFHYDVFELYPYKNGVIDTSASAMEIQYVMNKDGNFYGVKIELQRGLEPIFFSFKQKLMQISGDALARFVSVYRLGGIEARIKLKGESLLMEVPGQGVFTLIPIDRLRFNVQELDGFSILFEEDGDEIVAATFFQPQGNYRIERADD